MKPLQTEPCAACETDTGGSDRSADFTTMTRGLENQLASHQHNPEIDAGDSAAGQVLSDYYRCPEYLARCLGVERQSGRAGYFRLGEDTICYGRLASGGVSIRPNTKLADALDRIKSEAPDIVLPFNATEVVENLRRERYAAQFREEGRLLNRLLRKAYYSVRPLLGISARRHLQRMCLRYWNDISFPGWPVDTTVERVHQKLLALAMRAQGLERVPFIWFWPEGFSSCAIMTHDVETQSGKEFCSRLMDLDEAFGFRSAFQVIPENRYSVSKSFLQSIVSRGFELNVHDLKHDGLLYADRAEFLRRAERINRYIREYGAQGFRSGILYRNADWYDAFEFSYDMSLPNVAHLDPQRGGCCTVMPYFIGRIVELPLTATQDYTLFHILGDYSIDLWKEQIALIRANYGLINFIVHPDYMLEPRAQDLYTALLRHLLRLRAEGDLWTALPSQVADWWRQRSQMDLVFDDGQWRVRGAGKERACIAYAELIGDEVAYRLADRRDAGRGPEPPCARNPWPGV
jgi:hypothetical protein